MTLGLFGNAYSDDLGADVQLFESVEFGSVRVVVKDGEPWFVAIDVCRALDLTNPTEALRGLDEDEKNTLSISEGIRGNPNKAIVSEAGLYSLVLRSRKPGAKSFKRWITHDVLPSIRKTGGYSLHPAVQEALDKFNVPRDYLSALKQLVVIEEQRQEAESRNQELEAKVSELEPKARYHDNMLNSDRVYIVTQIAKDYRMSAKAFNKLLSEMGIQYQYKQCGQWFLYAKYQGQGYTKSITERLAHGLCVSYTAWTEKGREFLYYELAKMGIYPTADASLSPSDARAASKARLEAGCGYSIGVLEDLDIGCNRRRSAYEAGE